MKIYLTLSASLGAACLFGFDTVEFQTLGASLMGVVGSLIEQARDYLDPQLLMSALSGSPANFPNH